MAGLRTWLADRLALAAAARMRRRYPDWAEAILHEHASLEDEGDKLAWGLGVLRASLSLPDPADLAYLAMLTACVAAMALYQWSADEGLGTLAILCLLGLGLGLLRPSRFLASGLVVGAVVTAVNGFETLSGLRPAYETHAHSLAHDLRWLMLLAPALASSALGRRIGLTFAA